MASTVTVPAVVGLSPLPASAGNANFAGAVRSEFTKIRSLRSTYWTLVALFVISVGISALFSFGHAQSLHQNLIQAHYGPARAQLIADAKRNAVPVSLFGLLLGQLVIVVLGALTITSEYSTGMIRTSLSTMPRRGVFFTSKALVFTVIALIFGELTSFTSFFLGQAIQSSQHINATIGQPGVLRAVIGGGLFLAVCGLLSYGLGVILRHTAGAITAGIGLLFVVYILSGFLPSNWANHVDKWIPFNAGAAIWERVSGNDMFAPWTGFAVFCGYTAVALIAGLILFRKRNA
jgi:ABC-type transport system involved in multi-copper enzyme maturation permease subunit